jgi:hypothetical protein
MSFKNEELPSLEMIELTCECGNPEQYFLDPTTYELKVIECSNCQSKIEL